MAIGILFFSKSLEGPYGTQDVCHEKMSKKGTHVHLHTPVFLLFLYFCPYITSNLIYMCSVEGINLSLTCLVLIYQMALSIELFARNNLTNNTTSLEPCLPTSHTLCPHCHCPLHSASSSALIFHHCVSDP